MFGSAAPTARDALIASAYCTPLARARADAAHPDHWESQRARLPDGSTGQIFTGYRPWAPNAPAAARRSHARSPHASGARSARPGAARAGGADMPRHGGAGDVSWARLAAELRAQLNSTGGAQRIFWKMTLAVASPMAPASEVSWIGVVMGSSSQAARPGTRRPRTRYPCSGPEKRHVVPDTPARPLLVSGHPTRIRHAAPDDNGPDLRFRWPGAVSRWWAILGLNQ